ncbi:MAG: trimeric autotransporter adhesin [Actinomycetota bacterium]|nr:trimeric autotransporter adhesin [Actinomycetota bacterium]
MFRQSDTRRRVLPARRGLATVVAGLMAAGTGVGVLTAARAATPTGPAGNIVTVAGNMQNFQQYGYSGDGGPATAAQLYNPRAIGFAPNGDVYVADALNERIRKIDAGGVISTFAGSGPSDSGGTLQNGATPTGANGDGGPATAAVFNQPHGVAVDSKGNVYVADSNNQRIRKIDTGGTITTIAGTGDPKAPPCATKAASCDAAGSGLKFPKSMFMAPGDKLYVADSGNNMIRRLDLAANPVTITTVAGNSQSKRYGGDGGRATDAQLNTPEGVGVDSAGNIYISDSGNNLVRKVDANGTISTIAGDVTAATNAANAKQPLGPSDSAGDGGPATSAHLDGPRGIAVDGLGNVFVAQQSGDPATDTTGARVRRIDPSGTITTIAGDGKSSGRGRVAGDPGPVPASQAEFNTMHDLAVDSAGNLWIADSKNNLVRVVFDPAHAAAVDPGAAPSPASTPPAGSPPPGATANGAPTKSGYWMLGAEGKIFPFGDAKSMGDPSAAMPADTKATRLEPTPTAAGYWVLNEAGSVYAYGDAPALGGVNAGDLGAHEKATSLSATPSGKGYWIFTTKGRVFPFGDAASFGDLSKVNLNGAVQSSIATPSGKGYFMVASDGGVFAFGDAIFRGSMGAVKLNQPVQSLVPTRDGVGYWLVASDGGIFAFGNAPFRGSMGDKKLNKPVVGMVRYGAGYLMVAADGGIFSFSDRPFVGSLGDNPPSKPIVFAATLDS